MNRLSSKTDQREVLSNRSAYWTRRAGRLTLLVVVLVLLPVAGVTESMDRFALGRILETLPPNGPFWKYGNVVMRHGTKKAGMAPVIFPHWNHRARYTCRVCHLELGFSMSYGNSGITRRQYLAGAYCGTCHDGKIAFSAREESGSNCIRCHMQETSGLQQCFEAFAAKLPEANFGNGIDWARAINDGQIEPVTTLQGAITMPLPEKLHQPLKLGTTSPRSDVLFSHKEHFAELDCSSCHPDLFNIQGKGTQALTMGRNLYGEFCGGCHMRVAFPMNDCRRCHPQMKQAHGF